jgi:hypothetical protein
MSLSCSCDFDPSDFVWWWEGYSPLKPVQIGRRKRCCSCKELINIGTETIEFYKYRHPKNDIEERIYSDMRVPIASSFMCEECSGLFLALDELGYGCLDISQPMREYIAEYNEIRKELSK